ncbi:MAG TPA: CHAT domain-containing protein [Pyrinomonadaceae bacterium]|nr:CHAT domain-containing protein [Pyrinomonadaceae bacterium]
MDTNVGAQKEELTIESQQPRRNPQLKVVATLGSITNVKAPVVVTGSYKGIAPAGALKALDTEVNGWVSQAIDQGMVGGELGQIFFVPIVNKEIRAQLILLAGMGEYGRFSYDDLRYLAMNVCLGVSRLKLGSFASVLIGSGEGNLEIADALRGLLSGFCDALHRVEADERVNEYILVEFDKNRFGEIVKTLNELKKQIKNVDLDIEERVSHSRTKKPVISATTNRKTQTTFVNRVTIEHSPDGYVFSALTNSAVVPMRKVNVRPFFTEGIAAELRDGEGKASHEKFGRLLHNYIFPEEFERLIDDGRPLTLLLDKDTARLPWEMACYGSPDNRRYFGPTLKLTRQFRTMLTGIPGIPPPINKSLRVLLIADPAKDQPLPFAAEEGELVEKILLGFKDQVKDRLTIEIESRIGPRECKAVEILALVLNEPWDIVHYSGHAVYNVDQPNDSGWVFSNGVILSAREIFRIRQVPRLVFANACFSAATGGSGKTPAVEDSDQNRKTPLLPAEETNRKLAGLAEAFFERGIQNYIGTGWQVGDGDALQFAQTFYEEALKGRLLGDALASARQEIFDSGSTWGAYQHYGQSNARIIEGL